MLLYDLGFREERSDGEVRVAQRLMRPDFEEIYVDESSKRVDPFTAAVSEASDFLGLASPQPCEMRDCCCILPVHG